ncbi:MAG TPA: hypothetical protein VFK90_17890, partial [Anaeromyxobacter sp.]|nr:hypothetical protein [Anaeromyxobacter sp.]
AAMRAASLPPLPVLLAAGLAAGCAGAKPLQAIDPGQAISTAPNEAQAEVAGVTVRAMLGGWRGNPRTLEQRLTPVDVTVHNGTRSIIRLGPEAFTLETPNGPQRVLTQDEAAFALRDLTERRQARDRPRIGAVGNPTFPGYDAPGDPHSPFARSPPGAPVPELSQWYETQPSSGTLAPGETTSIMLFFGTPARSLGRATFDVKLVDAEGTEVGEVKMPFARE